MRLIHQEKTDIWYRLDQQVRSSSIRLPVIHGTHKGLDPHIQPSKQKTFPIQTVNKRMPISKSKIGQGRAGLRRKVKLPQPISLPQQPPTQPIIKQIQKGGILLPESISQSQNDVQPRFMPRHLSQHQPIDPTHIPQQIGPKIQHRPTSSYHDPYMRSPPRPPDTSEPLGNQKIYWIMTRTEK